MGRGGGKGRYWVPLNYYRHMSLLAVRVDRKLGRVESEIAMAEPFVLGVYGAGLFHECNVKIYGLRKYSVSKIRIQLESPAVSKDQ
jgi:hypothetical protein